MFVQTPPGDTESPFSQQFASGMLIVIFSFFLFLPLVFFVVWTFIQRHRV